VNIPRKFIPSEAFFAGIKINKAASSAVRRERAAGIFSAAFIVAEYTDVSCMTQRSSDSRSDASSYEDPELAIDIWRAETSINEFVRSRLKRTHMLVAPIRTADDKVVGEVIVIHDATYMRVEILRVWSRKMRSSHTIGTMQVDRDSYFYPWSASLCSSH
jgi:hypothetical protein